LPDPALGNVAYGDASDADLLRKKETLSNFGEYVPLGLILLGILEYNYGQSIYVVLFGGVFLAVRIAHAVGMLYTNTPLLRAVAMLTQHAIFVTAGGVFLYQAVA